MIKELHANMHSLVKVSYENIKRFFKQLRRRPDRGIQFDPEYITAHEFKNTYKPKQDKEEYKWVGDYAHFVYEQFLAADQILDAKAESVMKVFGGGTGLLSLGAVINLSKLSTQTCWALGLAIIFALTAILRAALVRVPRQAFVPPSVAWALSYVDYYKEKSSIHFLPQWHLACEGMRLTLRLKSQGVRVATWFGLMSIFAVASSFATAIIWPVPDSQSVAIKQREETRAMSSDQSTNTPVPDPSGSPQTPDPAVSANPQTIERGSQDPNAHAEPQSIQFSHEIPSGVSIISPDPAPTADSD